jgi:hypothetical protein
MVAEKKYRVVLTLKDNKEVRSLILEEKPEEVVVANFAAMYDASSYRIDELDHVSPGDGGCWFCSTRTDDMLFDTEFDTFVHKDCLTAELFDNPDNPEAQIMSYLLD